MILICCVDDRMGMAFDGRRLSSDSVLTDRIIQRSLKSTLWINDYSRSLFDKSECGKINISAGFGEAKKDDFFFVENLSVADIEESAGMIILYKWNRAYPSDLKFDIDLNNWELVASDEFKGSSHKKITEEVYIRNVLQAQKNP